MTVDLVHIGFSNILAMNRVIAVALPNSAPIRRIIQESRSKGMLIDLTNGRRTKAVAFADSCHVILSALAPETIAGRLRTSRDGSEIKGESILRNDLTDEKVEA